MHVVISTAMKLLINQIRQCIEGRRTVQRVFLRESHRYAQTSRRELVPLAAGGSAPLCCAAVAAAAGRVIRYAPWQIEETRQQPDDGQRDSHVRAALQRANRRRSSRCTARYPGAATSMRLRMSGLTCSSAWKGIDGQQWCS